MAPILIITGDTGTGKSTVLKTILSELNRAEVNCGGILAPGRFIGPGKKEFDLELYPGQKKYFMSSKIKHTGWEAIGGFWFNPEAVEAGLLHLYSLMNSQFDLHFVDEIGPFELDGHLWAPAVPDLFSSEIPLILTVRKNILEQVCLRWDICDPEIVTVEESNWVKPLILIRTWLKDKLGY